MNMTRKAVSPVIATIIVLVITIAAAIALSGYVFTLFGSEGKTVQASVTSATLVAGAGGTFAVTCASTGNTVSILNSGTRGVTISSLSLTYGGNNYNSGAVSSTCNSLTGGQTETVAVTLGAAATSGESYEGSFTLSDGTVVPFTGAFT